MKIGEFFKSKRNQTIIAQSAVGLLAALFPEKFAGISAFLRALFGVN